MALLTALVTGEPPQSVRRVRPIPVPGPPRADRNTQAKLGLRR